MECAICLEDCHKNCYTVLQCKHKFHTKCIIKNMIVGIQKDVCPLCRKNLDDSYILSDIFLDDIEFENLIENELLNRCLIYRHKMNLLENTIKKLKIITLLITLVLLTLPIMMFNIK